MAQTPARMSPGADRPNGVERGAAQLDGIAHEIDGLRIQARQLADELTHRLEGMFDVGAVVRRHLGAEIGVGALLGAAALGLVAWRVARARRERQVVRRVARKLAALRALVARPEEVAPRRLQIEWGKVITALLAPAASATMKALTRGVERKALPAPGMR